MSSIGRVFLNTEAQRHREYCRASPVTLKNAHKQEIVLQNGKTTVNIEMTGTPGLYSRGKDGTVVYQAIYKLEYYKEV